VLVFWFLMSYLFGGRNDICTITLWQLFDNFLYHTYIMLLFFLYFFSLSIVFDQWKERKRSCHNNCLKWLFKYHYSFGGVSLVYSFFILGTKTPQRCIHLERRRDMREWSDKKKIEGSEVINMIGWWFDRMIEIKIKNKVLNKWLRIWDV